MTSKSVVRQHAACWANWLSRTKENREAVGRGTLKDPYYTDLVFAEDKLFIIVFSYSRNVLSNGDSTRHSRSIILAKLFSLVCRITSVLKEKREKKSFFVVC